jgi:hypothetical protein
MALSPTEAIVESWVQAIQKVAEQATFRSPDSNNNSFRGNHSQGRNNNNNPNSDRINVQLQKGLADLKALENSLKQPNPIDENENDDEDNDDDDGGGEDDWDLIPVVSPPPLHRTRNNNNNNNSNNNNTATNNNNRRRLRNNRHHNGDDDDDEEEEDEHDNFRNRPTSHNSPSSATTAAAANNNSIRLLLNKRRLLIRLWTSQAEVMAMCAASCLSTHQWKQGAEWYTQALERIAQAQEQADYEVARWWFQQEEEEEESALRDLQPASRESLLQLLLEDADIVQVALNYFSQERLKFHRATQRHEAHLQQRLQPQWESRDFAKFRMGEYKWKHNPAPKNDYQRLRLDDERQLRVVQDALKELVKSDPSQIMQQVYELREQMAIQQQQQGPSATHLRTMQRYNHERPSEMQYNKRVSMELYPDPTQFGWLFTGSWKVVEFFEKNEIKLDWYFTTATVKTSMDHPTQGRTQLFRKKVTPKVYRRILENPRAHTNQGYQRRNPSRT